MKIAKLCESKQIGLRKTKENGESKRRLKTGRPSSGRRSDAGELDAVRAVWTWAAVWRMKKSSVRKKEHSRDDLGDDAAERVEDTAVVDRVRVVRRPP